MGSIFDWSFVVKAFPEIVKYLPVTLGVAIVSMFFGLLLGLIAALAKIYKIPLLKQLSGFYISFIRGTPLLVQLYLSYYGIPKVLEYVNLQFNWELNVSNIPALVFVFITFSINVGAYLSETIRVAIEAVDRGQLEAAYTVGMSTFQAMKRVIMPQALVIALPNFGNTFISLIKDTSLAFLIAVVEIMGSAKIIGARGLRFFEVYIVAALIYWVVCIIVEQVFVKMEARLKRHERGLTP